MLLDCYLRAGKRIPIIYNPSRLRMRDSEKRLRVWQMIPSVRARR